MKLLLDAMWSPDIAEQLRRRGHDVISVVEYEELREQSDAVLFAYARREGRCIVTEDVREYRVQAAGLLAVGESHPGLIFTADRRFSRHDPQVIGPMVTALEATLTQNPDLTNAEHWLS